MARPLLLRLHLDDRAVSAELARFVTALAALSDKLSVSVADRQASPAEAPWVAVCHPDGTETGLAFHGVPGGHEFTSFVLGLYNAAGPGQPLDADLLAAARAVDKKVDFKVLVSLSCTMCPELVTAAQRIAAENPNITAQVYDLNHFPEIKDRFNVMSVPCLVVNEGEKVSFGKKNVAQLLELLK
jgi:thioredoxin reductase (NADPH)